MECEKSYKDGLLNQIDKWTSQAGDGMRVLAFASVQMTLQEWDDIKKQYRNESQCLFDQIVNHSLQFTMIGAVALNNPVREDVRASVKLAK